MKLLILVLLFPLTTLTFAQDSTKVFSYYFKSETSQFKTINEFTKNQIGIYKLQKGKSTLFNNYDLRIEAGEDLIIDETGIYILKNKILNISRTEIRENSKYSISNGYLHGVLKNDSLAVALQGELFYFLMPSKGFLFESNNKEQQIVDLTNNSLLVLSKEDNGYYSALKIDFNNSEVSLSELDLNFHQTNSILHVNIIENGITTFILNPNQKNWKTILNNFVLMDSYQKK